MTDAEFWDHVFHRYDAEAVGHWAAYYDDIWAIDCARCGRTVEVDDETASERERDAFCDDCADETVEEDDEQLTA
jgi:hypothetical protein